MPNLCTVVVIMTSFLTHPASGWVGGDEYPSSVVRRPSSVVRRPSSVVRRPSSVVRRPSSVVRRPSSVVRSSSTGQQFASHHVHGPQSANNNKLHTKMLVTTPRYRRSYNSTVMEKCMTQLLTGTKHFTAQCQFMAPPSVKTDKKTCGLPQ